MTETIQQALEQKNMLPEEHLLDRGYVTPQVLSTVQSTMALKSWGRLK